MRLNKNVLLLLLLLLFSGQAWSEDKPAPPPPPADLSGEWRVLIENSNGKKYIRFRIEEKDARLRGKMKSREMGTQDLDGRREADGKILFWSTYYDRAGGSTETNFKGYWDGEAIVGDGRYFDRPVKFRAEPVEDGETKGKE